MKTQMKKIQQYLRRNQSTVRHKLDKDISKENFSYKNLLDPIFIRFIRL